MRSRRKPGRNGEITMIDVKVYDSDFHPYKVLSAFTDPRSASIEVRIEPQKTSDISLMNRNFLMGAKIVDDRGSEYRVAEIHCNTDIEHSMVLNVEPVKKSLKDCIYKADRPDFDGIAKYIFDCMVSENLINPECKIGTAKDRIKAFVRASAYLDNNPHANPEPLPE